MNNITTLNPARSSLSLEDAESLVIKINGDPEADWIYSVVRDPNSEGYLVDVTDMDGLILGYL